MNPKIVQLRQNPVTIPKNGFAGREVFAEILKRRSSPAHDAELRAEIEEEFRALSGRVGPGHLPADSGRIERDLRDALGVPVSVIELPAPALSQRQVERLSTELKKIGRAKAQSLGETPDRITVSREVAEEFAAASVRPYLSYSSADTGSAERDMSDICGVRMSVREYSKSKKKDTESLDRE